MISRQAAAGSSRAGETVGIPLPGHIACTFSDTVPQTRGARWSKGAASSVLGSFGCVWPVRPADCMAMQMPQDRGWIWTRVPKTMEEREGLEARRRLQRETGRLDTAAGTILRLRRRLGPLPVCAREADAASA